ncbi:hypothetical protein J5X98_01495 [Leptothermofonsia sichuanensis E412]|uniref:hypothetical protein n=1 Tax=Leptothermofonsia sichuanensis TaxID=2917832 RepID=UPI001CA723C1|nr:hypothetical protein [Leptothermofonsia sichuanensis]QZZ19429.1 hypothetical protein J5X98_18935 [Leptothermofonsia sichuanensis E412]QZZ21203.1 hypothetical protein J5X98_01495 [Leptothermofonsia sichuanensis E412]
MSSWTISNFCPVLRDTACYQAFLEEFSKAYPDSLNILQVDNGRFHSSKDLVVPENVILLFQPAYCPELQRFSDE